MNQSFLVSDIHGSIDKCNKLFELIRTNKPDQLFIAGDIFPSSVFRFSKSFNIDEDSFFAFLTNGLKKLNADLGVDYPKIFAILGNDDPKALEELMISMEKSELLNYMSDNVIELEGYAIAGYSYVPPTPFRFKDWEKYDVSRFTDHGAISPEEGIRTVPIDPIEIKYSTIHADLKKLKEQIVQEKFIMLFHSPPYKTNLDRAGLDGKMIEHIQVDVHVGSIAIRKFIEEHQPVLTLHGHIHESTRITGSWKDKIENTVCFNAAHDGKELSVIQFDINDLSSAERILI
ncbi:MAG: metallophosphoesterase [Bacteroidetes bacterium]|nr:metallophosphoesterase [Bacteroidota bacterium]MBU1678763.1 metallophosphoesterase [Bacteroidota bacterium]MBU2507221.1 metallophosphoesterase [Bacteroidota bacterium]